MFKRMRMLSAKRVLKSMKAVIIIASILCFLFFKETVSLIMGPKDILTLSENKMDHKLVTIELDSIYESFMSVKVGGTSTNNFLASFDDNHSYISVQGDYIVQRYLQPLQQQTFERLKNNSTHGNLRLKVNGILVKMTEEEIQEYKKSLESKGISENNEIKILPYVLKTAYKTYNDESVLLLWGGSGIALALLVILRLIKAFLGGYQSDIKKQLKSMEPEKADSIIKEYEGAKGFAGEIRVGSNYTFCHKGAKTVMFPVEDIQGIYVQKAKIQTRKDIIKNDLYIHVKNGDKYKITGTDPGHIINYYKENHPEITPLITHVLDYEC